MGRLSCCKGIPEPQRRMQPLYRIRKPFYAGFSDDFDQRMGRPAPFDPSHRFPPQLLPENTRLALWSPDQRMGMKCACVYESFYPAMIYYLNRLKDWGLCFRQCKVCSRFFLAKSQRYELCSEKCRKAQALQNKREFDERAREKTDPHRGIRCERIYGLAVSAVSCCCKAF